MTTTERPADSATGAAQFSEPFTVTRDGREYVCRTVELFGREYEICSDDRDAVEVLQDIMGETPWDLPPETEQRLVNFLDTYRVVSDDRSE